MRGPAVAGPLATENSPGTGPGPGELGLRPLPASRIRPLLPSFLCRSK